jgi:ParB family chromosome partitioning protein
MLETGALSPGHARALLALPDPTPAAEEVVSRGLNVRATEALVRRRVSRSSPPTPPPSQPRDANTAALERELTDALGLKVAIAEKSGSGTLTVHFTNLDQLDRILALLRPG